MKYNIVTEYINFAKSCINKYLKKILGKYYNQEYASRLLNVYMNSRYFDVYLSSQSNLEVDIRENLKSSAGSIKNEENKNELKNLIKAFEYIFYFDNVVECPSINEKIDEIEIFRKEVLGINKNKKFNQDLFDTIRDDLIKKKEYLDTVESKKFDFDCTLTNIRNLYDVTLTHNLKFPVVYNSTVIDKVFNSKELSQRKAVVEFSYAALKVLKDTIKGNFEYKYLVQYPSGISKKKTLSKKMFSILDNDILKEKIFIKISYEDFEKEKDEIYSYMRDGYKFVVILEKDINVEKIELLSIFKYIMIDKNKKIEGLSKFKNLIFI